MKCKRKKATFGVLAPNIQRGGMAIPLGNNLYWMKGRKHKTGGIDIGKDLEVENNEVMQMLPNETRVFSSVKMLGGNSPAELVASGMNPNMVFNAQEEYKRINRIKDDGSRYKRGGRKRADDGTSVETNNLARILYNNRYRNNKSTSLKMNNEEKVLTMANYVRPKNNYEYAVDGEDNYLFPFRKLANTAGLPSGLSNCTLTVSQLYNPARPINHARTITKNPRANGFYEVGPDYAIPGSMVIASNNLNDNDENNVYHTMVLTGFADKDYTYNFNGNSYKIKKGAPLVSYSRGGNNIGDWRTNIPLDVYMDNSDGRNFVRYYRPLDENGNPNILLDQLTVQPKKYGGKQMNLQNIDNPLARNSKRMISPNKLGTIVRVDGNGRDRLAYIPSTGSSKQDMKCGGRAKAPFGSSLSRLNSMLSQIDMDALSNAWDRVEEIEDEKYNNVKSNMIQLDDGTFIKESLPEVDVSPKRDLFRFPTLNITSAPYTELRRPDFKIGNPIIPDNVRNEIKGPEDYKDYHWIKSATDLLTTGLSTFNNLYYLNKMKEPPRPAVNPGVKLKTKWNNNATLSAIRESLGNTITDLVRNTASSQNLRNSINQARINALGLINKSNEDKENKETELINADLRQRATNIKDNVDNYNTWRNSLAAFRNNIFDKRSETWNNMMSNVNKVVNEAIENREQRDAERRQFDFLSYAYPIVRNNPAISNYLYDILFGKNKQSKS